MEEKVAPTTGTEIKLAVLEGFVRGVDADLKGIREDLRVLTASITHHMTSLKLMEDRTGNHGKEMATLWRKFDELKDKQEERLEALRKQSDSDTKRFDKALNTFYGVAAALTLVCSIFGGFIAHNLGDIQKMVVADQLQDKVKHDAIK